MAQFIPQIIAVASAAYGAKTQSDAGAIAAYEAETQATAEETAAQSREADRKTRLAEAIASQQASFSASGISAFSGSPLTVMRADVERERENTQRDRTSSQVTAMTQRYRGLIANKQAKAGATVGLLRAGADLMSN